MAMTPEQQAWTMADLAVWSDESPNYAQDRVRENADAPVPRPRDSVAEEDFGAYDYVAEAAGGLAYGVVEGAQNTYDTVREIAELGAEAITGEELFNVEDSENPFDKPTTITGGIASGVGQFLPALIPGAAAAKGTIWAARVAMNMSRNSSALISTAAVNNLTAGLLGLGTKAPRLASLGKSILSSPAAVRAAAVAGKGASKVGAGAATVAGKVAPMAGSLGKSALIGGYAEQLAFDPNDGRLADFAVESEIPWIVSIAENLANEDDDSEAMKRGKMLAEGMMLGAAFDLALMGARGVYRGINRKGTVTTTAPDGSIVYVKEKDAAAPTLTKEDVNDMTVSGKPLDPASVEGTAFVNTTIRDTLSKSGFDGGYIDKYIGSLNTMHLSGSSIDTYALLKETGNALEAQAKLKGEVWPRVEKQADTLKEAATLLGHDSVDAMNAALSQTEGMLKIKKIAPVAATDTIPASAGRIEIGAGLQGLTAYAVAARQLLMNTNELVITLSKEATLQKPVLDALGQVKSGDPKLYADTKAAFMQQVLIYQNIQDTVNNIAGEAGRLLSSFNMNVKAGGVKPTYINDLISNSGTDIDDIIANVATSIAKKEAASTIPLTAVDRFNVVFGDKNNLSLVDKAKGAIGEYWYNAVLYAPDTQSINVLGNTAVQLARTFVEAPIGAIRGEAKALGAKMAGDKDFDPGSVMLFEDVWARMKGMTWGKSQAGSSSKVSLMGEGNPAVFDKMVFDVAQGLYGKGKTLEDVFAEMGPDVLYSRTKDLMVDQQAAAVSSAWKAVQLFGAAIKHEAPTEARYTKFELSEANQGRHINIPVVGRAVRGALTVMGAFDVGFKSIADNAALYESAYRELRSLKYRASRAGGGQVALPDGTIVKYDKGMFTLPGEGLPKDQKFTSAEYIEHLVANPTKNMDEYAKAEMLQMTLQQDTAITIAANKLKTGLNFVSVIPVGTMLMPFVRTPINLVAYSLDRTPLGLLAPDFWRAKGVVSSMKGKKNLTISQQRDLADANIEIEKTVNKQIAGAGYLTLAALAAEAGYITGGGPSDFKALKRKMSTGWRPYSVRIMGKYYSINRLDPFSQMAALASDVLELTKDLAKMKLSPEDQRHAGAYMGYIMNNMVGQVTKMMSDKTYLKSIGTVMKTMMKTDEDDTVADQAWKVAQNVTGSVLGGFVPNFVPRAAEAFHNPGDGVTMFHDPFLRSTFADVGVARDFWARVTAKVPGLRDDGPDRLYPQINQFGQPIQKDTMPFGNDPNAVDQSLNFAFSIARPGRQPLTKRETELVMIEDAYAVRVLTVDKNFTPKKMGTSIALDPLLYYMRGRYQGRYYREQLMMVRDLPVFQEQLDRAEGGDRIAVKNVQDIIHSVQAAAREAGSLELELYHREDLVKLYGKRFTSIDREEAQQYVANLNRGSMRLLQDFRQNKK